MNPNRSLQASMWLMIAIQTIGSIDVPGKGPRKLPAPKVYVAVIVVWGVLNLVADAGMDRAAAAMGWATVLAGAILGPFGKTAVSFFDTVANKFSGTAGTQSASTSTTTGTVNA